MRPLLRTTETHFRIAPIKIIYNAPKTSPSCLSKHLLPGAILFLIMSPSPSPLPTHRLTPCSTNLHRCPNLLQSTQPNSPPAPSTLRVSQENLPNSSSSKTNNDSKPLNHSTLILNPCPNPFYNISSNSPRQQCLQKNMSCLMTSRWQACPRGHSV